VPAFRSKGRSSSAGQSGGIIIRVSGVQIPPPLPPIRPTLLGKALSPNRELRRPVISISTFPGHPVLCRTELTSMLQLTHPPRMRLPTLRRAPLASPQPLPPPSLSVRFASTQKTMGCPFIRPAVFSQFPSDVMVRAVPAATCALAPGRTCGWGVCGGGCRYRSTFSVRLC
jgi:hypothetical protein